MKLRRSHGGIELTPFEKEANELSRLIQSLLPAKVALSVNGGTGTMPDYNANDDGSVGSSSAVDETKSGDAQARVNAMISLKRLSTAEDTSIDRFFAKGFVDVKLLQKSCVHLGMRDPSSAAVMAAWRRK